MQPADLFAIWAPEGRPWSDWAKPVLFAYASESGTAEASQEVPPDDVGLLPDASARSALVVDLPGVRAVWTGLELARRGYRPVPLFNAAWAPHASTVGTGEIARALLLAAPRLAEASISADAPPVFLLDSARMSARTPIGPGVFDNRWMIFPQDFPSAHFMRGARIDQALWIGAPGASPGEDLVHVLLRWREQGVRVVGRDAADPARLSELALPRPPRFRSIWARWLALAGLRRNSAGGFGSVIPVVVHRSGFG